MRKAMLIIFAAVLVMMLGAIVSAQDEESTFELTIMHTNDTHAGHEPNGDGDGGVARQATVVNQIRSSVENTVLLDAGDRFSGTLFHTTFLGQDQVSIMNALGYDAMTLGNHEFDNGDDVLAAFVQGLNFPVVVSNMDFSASPFLGADALGDSAIEPFVVLEVGGDQVGIIGLNTADTVEIANPGDEVTFDADYAAAANAAAAALTEQGVNKIIVLTHTGINVDREFITALENVDVVLGGHSHTLLSNTYAGASDEYPLMFETAAGTPVYYAQAGANNLYLGVLSVVFDADGVIAEAEGDTVLLSRFITPDPEVDAIVADLAVEVEELRTTPINATTENLLLGDRNVCRAEECNFGNLIADAMRAEGGTDVAIMNAGGIRANIEEGDITLGEVLTVQPFSNLISTFEITGADLVVALENGVSGLVATDGVVTREGLSGRFPQVSGMRFSFDPTQEPGSRITSVEILNEETGEFEVLDPEAIYSVTTNNFVRTGGDGYSVFAENAIDPYDFGRLDYEVTSEFMAANSPLNYEVEGRITMENAEMAPLP